MNVQIVNKSSNSIPTYETVESAGMDLRADFTNGINNKFLFRTGVDLQNKTMTIHPGGRALVPTGIFTAIPQGYEFQIRSRSGLALKQGVIVLNSPGTIDSDYRNEWGVILMNLGDEPFEICQGDRIAQAVFSAVNRCTWEATEELNETTRGLGGFGHTGVK